MSAVFIITGEDEAGEEDGTGEGRHVVSEKQDIEDEDGEWKDG